jgi:hypothetical protein
MQRPYLIPYVVAAILWWVILGWIIINVDPLIMENVVLPHSYLPLIILWGLAVANTVAVWRKSTLKGLVWGTATTSFMVLRIFNLGHMVNLFLIAGLLITVEYYWRVKPTKSES